MSRRGQPDEHRAPLADPPSLVKRQVKRRLLALYSVLILGCGVVLIVGTDLVVAHIIGRPPPRPSASLLKGTAVGPMPLPTAVAGKLKAQVASDLHTLYLVSGIALCVLVLVSLLPGSLMARAALKPLVDSELEIRRVNGELKVEMNTVKRLRDELADQAAHDPLTGLLNRRTMDDTMAREMARCERAGAPLAVVLVDIDAFKAINDLKGHQAGDRVLQRVAALILASTRISDSCFRYGGDELLVVMPESDSRTAWRRATEWRERLSHQDGVGALTLSVGVASFPADGLVGEELRALADAALYEAKRLGRDRIVSAEAMKGLAS